MRKASSVSGHRASRSEQAGTGRCSRIAELERKIGQLTMENDFLKKALPHFRDHHPPAVVSGATACMKKSEQAAAKGEKVNVLCEMAGLSRAGYYRWQLPTQESPVEMEIRDALQQDRSGVAMLWIPANYGRTAAPRLRHQSQARPSAYAQGQPVMRAARKFVLTTESSHNLPVYPNLARDETDGHRSALGGRYHLHSAGTEFVFLAVVLDAFSRRVMGWALGRTLEAQLAIAALRWLWPRQPGAGLMHHSDRGVQYASPRYTDMLREHRRNQHEPERQPLRQRGLRIVHEDAEIRRGLSYGIPRLPDAQPASANSSIACTMSGDSTQLSAMSHLPSSRAENHNEFHIPIGGSAPATLGIYRIWARMALLRGGFRRPGRSGCRVGARVASLRCPILRSGTSRVDSI